MRFFIVRNWIILCLVSTIVAVFVWFTEGFFIGKAYMFFILALGFGLLYWRGIKNGFK